jgi:hypothetical protein
MEPHSVHERPPLDYQEPSESSPQPYTAFKILFNIKIAVFWVFPCSLVEI